MVKHYYKIILIVFSTIFVTVLFGGVDRWFGDKTEEERKSIWENSYYTLCGSEQIRCLEDESPDGCCDRSLCSMNHFWDGDKCMSMIEVCKEVARIDYDMDMPVCSISYTAISRSGERELCRCQDFIIQVEEQKIERKNSVEIIIEEGQLGEPVYFKIEEKVI